MALSQEELQIVEFGKSQGKSRNEVLSALSNYRVNKMSAQPMGQSRFSDLGQDIVQTGQNLTGTFGRTQQKMQDITQAERSGQNVVRSFGQRVGALAGGISSAIGDVFTGGAKAILKPQEEQQVKQALTTAITPIIQSRPVEAGMAAYERLKTENPALARDLEGIIGVASLATDIAGFGFGKKAATQAVETGAKTAGRLATATGEAVGDVVSTAAKINPMTTFVPKPTQEAMEVAISKSIKPSMASVKDPEYMKKAVRAFQIMTENKSDILGEVRNPKTVIETLDSLKNAKTNIYRQYDNLVKETGDAGAGFTVNNIAADLSNWIKGSGYSDEIKNYAQQRLAQLSSLDGALPSQVQDRIQELNSGIKFFTSGSEKIKNQIDASIAARLRESLDNLVLNTTGGNYQGLKNDYGALKTIENDLARAAAVMARKNGQGLIDFTDIFTGADIAAGVISGNPAMVASGLAGRGLKEAIKYLNSPDRYLNNLFNMVETLPKKSGIRQPTQKLLTGGTGEGAKAQVNTPINLGARSQTTIDAQEIERVQSQLKKGKPAVAETVDPLIQEARKYKSAEEFVRAQGTPVYHGTPLNISELKNTRTGENNYGRGGVFLTPDKDEAFTYGGGYLTQDKTNARVLEAFISPKAKIKEIDGKKLFGDKQVRDDKIAPLVRQAENEGYDGVVVKNTFTTSKTTKLNKAKTEIENLRNSSFMDKVNDDVLSKIESGDIPKTKESIDAAYRQAMSKYPEGKRIAELEKQLADIDQRHIVIFNDNVIKTKSQLEEIWKKANKK